MVDMATLLGLEPSSVLGSRLPLLRQLSHNRKLHFTHHTASLRGDTPRGEERSEYFIFEARSWRHPSNARHDRWLVFRTASKSGGGLTRVAVADTDLRAPR